MKVLNGNGNGTAAIDAALTSLDPGQEALWIVTYDGNDEDNVAQYEFTVR